MMPIRTEQVIKYQSGKINPSATLCNLVNQHLDTNNLYVSNIDFLSIVAENRLGLRLKLKKLSTSNFEIEKLISYFDLVNYILYPMENSEDYEIQLCDPEVILKFFLKLDYESLLSNPNLPLSHQVDILQLLIAETIYLILEKSKISPQPPKRVEFDNIGNIYAIIVAPNNVTYKLENSQELCNFISYHCKIKLPSYFIALLRLQVSICANRFINYLLAEHNNGLPLIFHNNKFNVTSIDTESKQIVFDLQRRYENILPINQQECSILQNLLTKELGVNFKLELFFYENDYKFIISANQQCGFVEQDLEKLRTLLTRSNLLDPNDIITHISQELLGELKPKIYPMPDQVSEILSCLIGYSLLDDQPVITPQGSTYNKCNIQRQIERFGLDPLSKDILLEDYLRPNLLVTQIISCYNSSFNYDAIMPELLINPRTNQPYEHPVVDEFGNTLDQSEADLEKHYYPNRCIENLIEYYTPSLESINQPIIRSGIRSTIGANLSILCSGPYALSYSDAANETMFKIPYIEYDQLTKTLLIYVPEYEYAKRLTYGLKKVFQNQIEMEPNIQFIIGKYTKNIRFTPNTAKISVGFTSYISLHGEDCIKFLFTEICNLPPSYFTALQELSGLYEIEILNGLLNAKEPTTLWPTASASSAISDEAVPTTRTNILTLRSIATLARLEYGTTQGANELLLAHNELNLRDLFPVKSSSFFIHKRKIPAHDDNQNNSSSNFKYTKFK